MTVARKDGRGARAVVFAYHDVGARCLRVLLAHGLDVALVVTHEDDPAESVWFERVADVAREHGLPVIAPPAPGALGLIERVAALAPRFLFSFYYRRMLPDALLRCASDGALNVHGSLLPKYRGRAPVNWAVLHGERETGATLHYMEAKPDAGDVVGQLAVPILPDDTAREVLAKVTVAAEIVLDAALPGLLAGTAPRIRQDLASGSYFRGRTPEDGRIDWRAPASSIHDLVRAVAPPYPGASTTLAGKAARVLATRVLDPSVRAASPRLELAGDRLVAWCGGGGMLHVKRLEVAGREITPESFLASFGLCVPFPT